MPSLLIVDDLPVIHDLIKSLVGPSGYLCAGAPNGEDALLRFHQSKFDVVLVDYAMTPMDGIALTYELLQHDPTTVIMLMSGFVDDKLQAKAQEAGIWKVIEKPFKFDEFTNTLNNAVIEARRRSQERRESAPESWPTLADHIAQREKAYVKLVLEAVEGNEARAASILGISIERLHTYQA